MSEKSTKERIIEAAEELMLEKSFHAVGLTEILTTANVPKGSFYHLFKSKEDFGVAMIKHYIAHEKVTNLKDLCHENPLLNLCASFEDGIQKFLANDCKCPCLIMKLTSEVSSFSEPMRAAVSNGFTQWVIHYTQFIEEAIQKGYLSAETDPKKEAQFLVDFWYGACHRAIATQSADPLQNALAHIKSHFIKQYT